MINYKILKMKRILKNSYYALITYHLYVMQIYKEKRSTQSLPCVYTENLLTIWLFYLLFGILDVFVYYYLTITKARYKHAGLIIQMW